MKKTTIQYVCSNCNAVFSKWVGKCEQCNSWNTVSELVSFKNSNNINSRSYISKVEFTNFSSEEKDLLRYKSNISEFDRVCGSGIVPGSVILLGGEPGIGKSTLLMQLVAKLSETNSCVYISGEESTNQLKRRAKRLNLVKIEAKLASASSLKDILTSLENPTPDLLIIDSIQTMQLESIDSLPGSISQVRACATEVINFCKRTNTAAILVGHVTREGQIAGPKVLEHMVDAVLYFEGDNNNNFRILRAVKNRFGASDEIGVFEMTEAGLEEVNNPSALFLSDYKHNISGTSVFAGIEGSRSILVEVQSLIAPSSFASPRRSVVGVDLNRLYMIMALLETKYKIPFNYKDVYVNIAGGLKINEPAIDLAVCASLLSATKNISLPQASVFIGEISLSGQIRNVFNLVSRVSEAAKLGFSKAYIPKLNTKTVNILHKKFENRLKLIELTNVYELIRNIFND